MAFGSGLGPDNISIAPLAFQTTNLSNTSVTVTVNGTTVNPPLYYTSATQVSALLPSNTPVGAGTITVTYNSRAGVAAPITVVPNNAGIFTIGSDGQGPGIVTYADYSLVSASKSANCGGPNTTCGAANPGDTLILWATGLGPVSGTDASGDGLGLNMPNLPLTVWLGGVQAPVAYQGRSGCCVGEDQIVFTVPKNIPTGCLVPLLIQIGDQISNVATMPVSSGCRDCTPVNPAAAAANAQQMVAAGPASLGTITLSPAGTYLSPGAYTVTGTGGADVNGFTAAITIPAAPVFTSPSFPLPPVTRSNGLTTTWTGGAANAFVQITLSAPTDFTNTNGAKMVCNVAAEAGTFTIPPYVLLTLPAGIANALQFQQQTKGVFTAKGLDIGAIQTRNAPTAITGFTLR